MRNGECGTAPQMFRERARFTRAADFVEFTSSEEARQEKTPKYDQAFDDVGPVGRERPVRQMNARVLELARVIKQKNAT